MGLSNKALAALKGCDMARLVTLFVVGYLDKGDWRANRSYCSEVVRAVADVAAVRRRFEADGLFVVVMNRRPA